MTKNYQTPLGTWQSCLSFRSLTPILSIIKSLSGIHHSKTGISARLNVESIRLVYQIKTVAVFSALHKMMNTYSTPTLQNSPKAPRKSKTDLLQFPAAEG